MNLCDLILKKEELPILHETCFQIPIHPKLIDGSIIINSNIAKNIFPRVAEKWSKELGKKFPEGWECDYQTNENGFVTSFSISRNFGGSLYFLKDELNCETTLPNRYVKFSKEKSKEFEFYKTGEYSRGLCYSQHNVDFHDGALFLRNWAIKYMNEVFKENHYLLQSS